MKNKVRVGNEAESPAWTLSLISAFLSTTTLFFSLRDWISFFFVHMEKDMATSISNSENRIPLIQLLNFRRKTSE